MIRKTDLRAHVPELPEIIVEISNPTQDTFYVTGESIESPIHHTESLRKDKWLRIPSFVCGTTHSVYPLKPGAKILTTVGIPYEERTFRYRFFFWRTETRTLNNHGGAIA